MNNTNEADRKKTNPKSRASSGSTDLLIAVVEDSGGDALRAARILLSLAEKGALSVYTEAVREPKSDDGKTGCHDNASALVTDLLVANGFGPPWSVCLGTSSQIGKHSWLEYGTAALDVRHDDKIIVCTTEFHLRAAAVTFTRRFAGYRGFQDYVRLLPVRA